jgi:putative membrane protein
MDWTHMFENLAAAALFGVLGLVLFALAMTLIVRISPFSVRKEIAEDQNVALGILIGAIFIGLALILSAAVHG